MPDFRIHQQEFWLEDQKTFLLMGELHYFRMPKENWRKALEKLKACGCNAVAYYVPWFVHQPEEDVFDFNGRLHPQNDLHTWIKLTQELELIGFLRPGPYVYAETTDLGIPKWFSRKHPEARVQAWQNGVYLEGSRIGCVSHQNPSFLVAVEKWLGAIAKEIAPYMAPDGNVAMVQLCNEIPCDDNDDRNPINLGIGREDGLFPTYLRQRYGGVETLNSLYRTAFTTLETVEPHQLEQADAALYADERLAYYYEFYYPLYFRRLKEMLEKQGIHAYFVHNAYNPRAVSLHTENRRQNPWLEMGLDCYFSLTGALGVVNGTYFCEYGAEYARRFLRSTPWVAEHECGFWNDFPKVYGSELYLWNLWTLAAGYRGINMYLFAAGVNRPGMGFFGTAHDWQAPLTAQGEEEASYGYIRRSLEDAKTHQALFMEENAYDMVLGVKDQPGLIWKKTAKASSEAYFTLRQVGFMPRLCDFLREDLEEFPALMIVSDETLEESVQQKLLCYVQEGGTLIVSGMLPTRTSAGESCACLAEGLGILAEPGSFEAKEQEKLIYEDIEYFVGVRVQPLTCMEEAVLARTPEGLPAVVKLAVGKGEALVLPFGLENLFHSTGKLLEKLLALLGIHPQVQGARELRVIPKASGGAVVLNPSPVTVTETIRLFGREQAITLAPYAFEAKFFEAN